MSVLSIIIQILMVGEVQGYEDVLITVYLSEANSTGTVTVDYYTIDGSATDGSIPFGSEETEDQDYSETSGTLQFPPGVTEATFNVQVWNNPNDWVFAGETKEFSVHLENPNNAVLALIHWATVKIDNKFYWVDVAIGGNGCFIATAAFGSYQEFHVVILRQFRDKFLLTNALGRNFVVWYYLHSPKYALIIADNAILRSVIRMILLPVYGVALVTLKFGATFWFILLSLSVRIVLIIPLWGKKTTELMQGVDISPL